jgi:hypothetical protein
MLLRIDESDLSALLAGRLAAFGVERLAQYLTVLGKDVEIVVREKPSAAAAGRLSVVPA